MKKALMGTTALVAAAVTTGVAVAEEMMAEPISLSVGGRSHWGVAIYDNEAAPDDDDVRISNDAQLEFTGSTVLDSGVEVAVKIVVEGEKNSDPADASFVDVSGSFGEIRIGNESPAGKKLATTAPYATYFYGINDSYWAQSVSSVGSSPWMTTYADAAAGDSASLLYFSPVINGFQFAVSYAPEAGKSAESATASTAEGNEVVSVGLRYDGAFGDTGVTVAVGYASKDVAAVAAAAAVPAEPGDPGMAAVDAAPGRTVTEWGGGIVVSMMGVSIGGSMSVLDDDAGSDDLTQFDFGIKYGEGPWSVSANVGNQQDDDANIDNDFARLLANYNLGPGINVAGALGMDSPNAGDNDGSDTTFAGIALGVAF